MTGFIQFLANLSGGIQFPDVVEVLNNLIKGIFG